MHVIDIMTSEVLTVTEDAGLKEAARRMLQAGVSGLPVVDDRGIVIGIITEADFVEAEAARSWGRQRRRLLGAVVGEHRPALAKTVAEVMTRRPIVIDQDSDVTEAARKMAEHGVKRLPVVTPDGRLVGIVSRSDIVMAFARPDEVIEDEIRNDIVERILLLDPQTVDVVVSEGAVTLRGEVPNRSDARILEELVARLEGVIGVAAELRWSVDDRAGR
jgi:CBS-domain-containing membrane protein